MIKSFLSIVIMCLVLSVGYQRQTFGATGVECGLLSCHGVDVTCGFNAPQMCDAMYRMGDFCRQYISCLVENGECRTVTQAPFDKCRACVLACEQIKDDPAGAFDCEASCREQLE